MTGLFSASFKTGFARSWLARGAGLLLASCLAASAAQAQANNNWPQRPINLVVGYPAGGTVDILGRLYADKLAVLLKQPVVVNNRAGASGTIGAQFVARANPDGYTILFAPSTFAIAPLLVGGASSPDVNADFTPIAKVGSTPLLMLTGAQSGISSVANLVEQAKNGKQFNYASPGAGSPMHMTGEVFNRQAGIKMLHIPYRGIAPSLTDTIGGHIPIVFSTHGSVLPYMSDNSLIALASTSKTRSPLLPHVPTLAEQGYPEIDITAWWAVLGPKGLDPSIVNILQTAFTEILNQPDVLEQLQTMAITPELQDGTQLAQTIRAENQYFGELIKTLDLKVE
ncbi:Bug family tripartite tricarboxylate transporter substrate binding protein [Lampropedia aestuarii]|uniref:Bug family tripartite tricarboxylate transporter substrate binding protein n=1 Tax=Lampropedia aestuarii TaxID=2562762 RepID=UPI002469355B|nr:tripartite tricarboxylate transporter substrate binding protein [Lampropedia aestuarii]MDH5858049.1 tripartite tricarboxylate transporter substrate binding protein [Lampropedia aestuarii]